MNELILVLEENPEIQAVIFASLKDSPIFINQELDPDYFLQLPMEIWVRCTDFGRLVLLRCAAPAAIGCNVARSAAQRKRRGGRGTRSAAQRKRRERDYCGRGRSEGAWASIAPLARPHLGGGKERQS